MADTTNPYESIENDPFRRKQNTAETGGNAYAYDINDGSPVPPFAGEDPFAAMQRAQEAAAGGDIPETSDTDPTADQNKEGLKVEQVVTTGGSVMGDKFDTMVKEKTPASIDIKDVTAGMSVAAIQADAHNARFDTGAQINPSASKRAEGIKDPMPGEDVNNAQQIYEASKTAAINVADVNAGAAEKIARVAAGDTTVDFSNESKKLADNETLLNQIRGDVTLTSNSAAASMGENIISQGTKETEEIKKAISEAEELKDDLISGDGDPTTEESSAEAATTTPEAPSAAVTAADAITAAKSAAETPSAPIDYSEAYKQATEPKAPVIDKKADAEAFEARVKNYGISEGSPIGKFTQSDTNDAETFMQSAKTTPEMPPQLTPEQQAALQRAAAAGEQKHPAA